jgi:hypothetical protein
MRTHCYVRESSKETMRESERDLVETAGAMDEKSKKRRVWNTAALLTQQCYMCDVFWFFYTTQVRN